MKTSMLLLVMAAMSFGATAQTYYLTTPNGLVGNNNTESTSKQVIFNSYTKMVNPDAGVGARTLIIEKDNDDSWLTFHDPNDAWFSMGIDRSNSKMFTLNSGGGLGDNTHLVMYNNGYLGLGLPLGTVPDQRLTVKGTVHAQEVKIDVAGALVPDYVFDKSYKLPSLETVKSYLEQNHHLPEVPSAKEMETNGMNVSEMNLLLLKKIEELTLYLIEVKSENASLKQSIEEINKKLK